MFRYLRDLIDAWRFRRRWGKTARQVKEMHREILRQLEEPIPPDDSSRFWIGVDPSTGRDACNLRFMDPEKERARRRKG